MLKKGIKKYHAELVEALRLDLGIKEKLANVVHLNSVYLEIDDTIKNFWSWAQPQPVDLNILVGPGSARIQPEPLGVALVMSAWNYPYVTGLPYVAACISAGNCVLFKPTERAPYCSKIQAKIFDEFLNP